MKLIYANMGGQEAHEPTRHDLELITRRKFIRTASLFLPMSFFAGSVLTAKAGSSIKQRTISAATQNAIQMFNATWARSVNLPGGWNRVRVGMRFHMTDAGNLTGQPTFAIGLCSGTANQYGDATTTHFVGMVIEVNPAATWSSGTTTYNLGTTGSCWFPRVRIGTSNTTGTALIGSTGYCFAINKRAATSTADRQLHFVDIIKGSPNYTFHAPFSIWDTAAGCSDPVFCGDVSAFNFLNYMGQNDPAPTESASYHANPGTSGPTLAVDEGANGVLNAVNLYWNRVDAAVEVCDVAVAILA